MKCKVEGCLSEERGHQGYCGRHREQIRRTGKIFGSPCRSQKSGNEFIIEGDVCLIKIFDFHGFEKAIAVLDKKDYKKVKDLKWFLSNTGYVFCRKLGIGLSTYLLKHKPSFMLKVDHKDHDPLNNRRINLRKCTTQQNAWNSKAYSNTGLKGISKTKKGTFQVFASGKYIGEYVNIIKAAKAYNREVVKVQGEFANLNKIGGIRT